MGGRGEVGRGGAGREMGFGMVRRLVRARAKPIAPIPPGAQVSIEGVWVVRVRAWAGWVEVEVEVEEGKEGSEEDVRT